MPPRFYVPEARAEETTIELPEDEASHLTRVLRLAAGDHIRIFNGRGQEWDARVEEASKQRVCARLQASLEPAAEPRVRIALMVAVLKGDKMDDIVRDAVMLGVSAIQPLITARTEISRAVVERGARRTRWQRIAVASAKQCGRAFVPDIRPVLTFDEAMTLGARNQSAAVLQQDSREGSSRDHLVMLVEPAAAATVIGIAQVPVRQELTLVVGPEGGWTQEEVRLAGASGAMLLTLGTQTLRADAVPIVALTAVRVHLEDF